MWRSYIVFLLISSSILTCNGKKENNSFVATIRAYVHEYVSGPNETLYEVARASITADSPTSFGSVRVGDDLMTSGPSIESEKLGRARGFAVYSGLTESVVMINAVFMFSGGAYNGSTISTVGRKYLINGNQELPIVGGTGAFRNVRGYILSSTYSSDPLNNYLVFIYDFYLENFYP